jgi:hypothetical protein
MKQDVGFYLHREGPNLGNSRFSFLINPVQAIA